MLVIPQPPAAPLTSPPFTATGGPPTEMLSIAWQADALVALSALGAAQREREIVTVTRSVP